VKGYRIAPGALRARLLPGDRRAAIARLSPEDATLQSLDERPLALAPRERLAIDLGGMEPLAATVVDADAGHVVFDGVELLTARDLMRLLDRLLAHGGALVEEEHVIERETIRAPERIRTVLHAAFANRCHARLRLPADATSYGTRLLASRLEPDSDTPLQWEPDERWPDPPFEISIDGYMSQVQFQVTRAENVDGFLAVPLPGELVRVRSRRQRRVGAPQGVTVSFRHPRWPSVRVRRAVRNVSPDGLLFSTNAIKDVVYPGLTLDAITVNWQDRLICAMTGVACHVSDDIDGEAQLAGVELRFSDRDERAHWEELVDRLLYPNTRADGTWSEQIWDLYRSSGYFGLSHKTEAEFAAQRESFRAMAPRLARTDLGARVVWPSARGLEASVSTLRVYEHSCIPFALARQPGRVPLRYPGRVILRDIYLHGFERLARWPDLRWLIVWVQKEGRFSRLVHFDMALRYSDIGRADILHFRAIEIDCDVRARAPVPDDVQLAPATAGDVDAFFDAIKKTRSQLDREAHDLVPERFDVARLKRSWSQVGLHRERQLIVARRRGRAVAAALLEAADDGLHLFCLLDLARLFALEPGGEALFPALLDAARAWYAELGKPRFIYFCEETAAPPGLRDLGEADAIVLPSELLPELMEHLYEVTAPRDVPRLK
jgi:hypothetical protein